MKFAAGLVLILIFTNTAAYIVDRLKKPGIIAMILVGLFFGIPAIKGFFFEGKEEMIFMLGDAGLVCLMFLAGLKSSPKLLYKEKKDAFIIATAGFLTPLILGTAVFLFMGYSFLISLIVGICLSISAEATRAKVLMELNRLRTRLGAALIGAGLADDGIGLILFMGVAVLAGTMNVKEGVLIAATLAAFFTGLAVKMKTGEGRVTHSLNMVLSLLVVPFFFVSLGMNFNYGALKLDPLIFVVIFFAAVISKLLGAFVIKPFTDFSFRQLHLIGWAMNSRGAIEMAIALIALRAGIIPDKMYSALIIMALLTTLIFPFVINTMVKKHPGVMDSKARPG